MSCQDPCTCRDGAIYRPHGLTPPAFCPPCVSELEAALTLLIEANEALLTSFEEGTADWLALDLYVNE